MTNLLSSATFRQRRHSEQQQQYAAAARMKQIQDDHYKATLKLSNPPPYYSPSPDSPVENEYAYVEDILPGPHLSSDATQSKLVVAPQHTGPLTNQYGALGAPKPAIGPATGTHHVMYPRQNVIGCEECRDPRHYFELDHDPHGAHCSHVLPRSTKNQYSFSMPVSHPSFQMADKKAEPGHV